MFNLYFKIAIRYLQKNKLYSFINIFGLAIGVASFVLIMLYVNYERSYDKFEGSENVQRVYMDYTEDGVFVPGDAQSYNLSGPTLKEEFPEIVEFVRLLHIHEVTIDYDNIFFGENKGALADPSFFDVFKYSLLKGDINTVLKEPYTILLTESFAKKIFGEENPLGKSLSLYWGSKALVTVTGILKDFPKNTHMKNDFLISFETMFTWDARNGVQKLNWNQNNFFTYLKLDEKADVSVLRKKIMDYKVESLPYERHNIESLEDIHLYSDKPYEAEANGSASRIRFLLAIAFIILILSWLNYVNLSTTKALERAKETGIRKVAGAQRSQIILQSLLESLLLNLIAIAIAFVIILIVLPIFSNYVGKELVIGFSSIKNLMPIIGFILLGTLVSGLYPALVLSNYTPAIALKGKIRASASGLNIRKGLIIGQFLATIILLVGTIVVTKQIKYLQEQPIGVELDQVVAINGKVLSERVDSLLKKDFKTLEVELKKFPFVKNTVTAQTYPGGNYDNLSSNVGITFPNGKRDDTRVWYNYGVHPGYFELMNMEFTAGEPFKATVNGYSNHVVLNERFVEHLGIFPPEDAVNKIVKFWSQDWVISGVIKDYHHFGLKTAIEPMLLRHDNNSRNLLVKLNQSALSTAGLNGAISQIESTWKDIFPKSTFSYTFLDQKFEAQYNEDKSFSTAFQIFTLLAILIASMGLFGLTSYTCIQRKKEIGIRKVNGATIGEVLSLLNKDFVKWVGIAFIIAVPLAWYAMNKWLEGFAYKITVSWWIFALAGFTALCITLITVSWQSFRAATNNPVEALRDE